MNSDNRSKPISAKPGSRLFQFNLKTALIVFLLIGAILGSAKLLWPRRVLPEGFSYRLGMTQKEVVNALGRPDAYFLNGKIWVYRYEDSPWQGTAVFEFDDQRKLTHVLQEIDDPQRQSIP
jgi:hypothetical protein